MSKEIIDKNKTIKIGVRKKDEIRECHICKRNCKNTYYSDVINNKQVWICNDCFKKLTKSNKKSAN